MRPVTDGMQGPYNPVGIDPGLALQGRDIIGSAETGSGKLLFVLPILLKVCIFDDIYLLYMILTQSSSTHGETPVVLGACTGPQPVNWHTRLHSACESLAQ